MLLPEEVEARATIPALVAKRLIHYYGLKQHRVAKLLGVTQAAVSNYFRETRGSAYKLEETSTVLTMVDGVARQMLEGADQIAVLSKFHEVASYVKGRRLMCFIHQKLEPGLDVDRCHICDAPN